LLGKGIPMSKPVLGVQLYTVREQLAADFVGTVRKVREIGYDAVELCGKGPLPQDELVKLLKELGLKVAGCHVGIADLEKDLDGWIAFIKAVQGASLVLPYLPDDRRKTAQDWVNVARVMDDIGAKCRAKGVKFSYHNHSFEFVKLGAKYALDVLYENCSPENVLCELDTYWIKHGGADPVKYIKKYSGRCCILHVKDMAGDQQKSFTEIGRGILDWKSIHKAATASGVQFYCVEQDRCIGNPFDSIAISLRFLRQTFGL
jgi:sugar phosphate isomerase/epimerase